MPSAHHRRRPAARSSSRGTRRRLRRRVPPAPARPGRGRLRPRRDRRGGRARRRSRASRGGARAARAAVPSTATTVVFSLEPEAGEHVVRARQRRRAELEQIVRARGQGRRDLAGHREHLSPLLQREVGGDQCAASLARLDDDGGGAEPGDDPVARREAPRRRLDSRCVFRDDQSRRGDPAARGRGAPPDSRGRCRSRGRRPSCRPLRARRGAPLRRCRARGR